MGIKKVINEVLDNFLNEELSINEELIKGVTFAIERIESRYSNDIGNNGNLDGHILTNLKDIVSFGDYGSIECFVTVIDFESSDNVREEFFKYDFGGETEQVNYRIIVRVFSINGVIDRQFMYNTLFHECEHAFQFLKRNKELYNTKSSYKKAVKIVNGEDNVHNSEEYVIVANILYFFNKIEIDAEVNGLYGELINNGCIIGETNFNEQLKAYKAEVKKLISNYSSDKYNDALRYFNVTYGKLISFVRRQNEYLSHKIRKVYQKAWNDSHKPMKENKIIKPIGLYLRKK